MTVILRYSFTNEDAKMLEKAKNYFEQKGMDCDMADDILFAEVEIGFSSDAPVEKDAFETVKKDGKALAENFGTDFTLSGVIDTSYSAGEYMDFQLDYCKGEFSLKASDWYVEEDMESYEDYEDFCENAFECTKEQYETVKDCEFVYILETEQGDVLSAEVPLYNVETDG